MSDQQLAVSAPPTHALALQRNVNFQTWNALVELYDGASPEKVALVIDICAARKLDPLKKPYHIVSTWSNRRKCMVETLWPAIIELRITAMRTGEYAGREETKFGPTITQDLGAIKGFQFPEWAQITVYRMIGGQKCTFPGPKVYWIESYSKAGKDRYEPNSMWEKRTWGQLEKCAEAAALRAAFPEETGGQATAEEMHGKELDEPLNVTHSATEPGSETTGAAPEETKKRRAVVPGKAKGAAAMSAGPVVEGETGATGKETATETTATVVDEKTPPPAEQTDAPNLSGVAAMKAKAEEAKKETAKSAKPDKPAEWPKTVVAVISDCVSAPVKGNPKYSSVKVAQLTAGTCVINGVEEAVEKLGRVIFDPERPELAKFAIAGDDVLELVLEQQPSSSNPAKMNTIVVKACLHDVGM